MVCGPMVEAFCIVAMSKEFEALACARPETVIESKATEKIEAKNFMLFSFPFMYLPRDCQPDFPSCHY